MLMAVSRPAIFLLSVISELSATVNEATDMVPVPEIVCGTVPAKTSVLFLVVGVVNVPSMIMLPFTVVAPEVGVMKLLPDVTVNVSIRLIAPSAVKVAPFSILRFAKLLLLEKTPKPLVGLETL